MGTVTNLKCTITRGRHMADVRTQVTSNEACEPQWFVSAELARDTGVYDVVVYPVTKTDYYVKVTRTISGLPELELTDVIKKGNLINLEIKGNQISEFNRALETHVRETDRAVLKALVAQMSIMALECVP